MEKYQYPLKDEFIEFCKTVVKNNKNKTFKNIKLESAESYAEDYLPGLRKYLYKTKSYPFEKYFLEVVRFLLSQDEGYKKCTQVLLRVYRIVQIEAAINNLEDYRTAFDIYAKFIQHVYIDKKDKLPFTFNMTPCRSKKLLKIITNELENGIVYYYIPHKDAISDKGIKLSINDKPKYNLWRILNNRLRTQDRTSGDKTWLSLDLIKAINPNALEKYVDTINEKTIIYADDNVCQKTIKCSDVWCIYLYRDSNQEKYKIKVTIKDDYKTYDVLTPTATLGTRIPMSVKGIRDVVIDHVKPIDQSLRELEANRKIPMLVKLSEAYKNAKSQLVINKESKPKDSEIVNEALDNLKNNQTKSEVKTSLSLEMKSLLNDSWYRLMDSNENSKKSNDNMFYEFRTNCILIPSPSRIIGIIMIANHSTSNTDMIVYQKLSKPDTNYVNEVSIVKSNYPYEIDLTSFKSEWGPKIL